jgi:hypothetical protein
VIARLCERDPDTKISGRSHGNKNSNLKLATLKLEP